MKFQSNPLRILEELGAGPEYGPVHKLDMIGSQRDPCELFMTL